MSKKSHDKKETKAEMRKEGELKKVKGKWVMSEGGYMKD